MALPPYIHDTVSTQSRSRSMDSFRIDTLLHKDFTLPLVLPFIHPPHPTPSLIHTPYCAACAAECSAASASFAVCSDLLSPAFPFCIKTRGQYTSQQPHASIQPPRFPHRHAHTSHFANFRSISPLFSAANLLSSFNERRTTRAATAR